LQNQTWSTPGPTKSADPDDNEKKISFASIDLEMARIHARSAERHFLHFLDWIREHPFEFHSEFKNIAPIWLNRLSDLLWLQAQILTQET
jgi:cob(I)alamin adenosyltransferase